MLRNEAISVKLRFFKSENSVIRGQIIKKLDGNNSYSIINGNFHPNFAIIGQNVNERFQIKIKANNSIYMPHFMTINISNSIETSNSTKIAYKFHPFLTNHTFSFINQRFL